jgi:hypothetical protein
MVRCNKRNAARPANPTSLVNPRSASASTATSDKRAAGEYAKLQRVVRDRTDNAGHRGWCCVKDRGAVQDLSARGAAEDYGNGLVTRVREGRYIAPAPCRRALSPSQ